MSGLSLFGLLFCVTVCLFVGQPKTSLWIYNLSLCFYVVFVCGLSPLEWFSIQSEPGTTKTGHLILQELPPPPQTRCGEMKEYYCFFCENELSEVFFLPKFAPCSLLQYVTAIQKPAFSRAHCNSILQTDRPFVFEYKSCDIHHT